jgi:metal-responsive CopG/Arc/MetJ family transcriptional regulator
MKKGSGTNDRITVCLGSDTIEQIDEVCKELGQSRSRFIARARKD